MYSNGYACFDPNDPAAEARWCAEAESLDGDFVGRFREAAKAHRVHVVSTFLERAEPKPFNAALLIDPGGHPLLHHRKVHICDFGSPSSRADAARSSRRATSRPSPAVFGWA
jgi:predicted amidohydrolase